MSVIKVYVLLHLFLLHSSLLPAQAINDSVFNPADLQRMQLVDVLQKKSTSFKNISFKEPLLLFVFISPECPICKNYTPVLNALRVQYGQAVKMLGIVPGRTYNIAAVNAFAKKYKTVFPLFIDREKKLTNYLHASVTPEVVLLNENYELVYKGAIDNRVKQLGLQKGQATQNYLSDAITQYLQHTSIAVKRIEAIGCLINDF